MEWEGRGEAQRQPPTEPSKMCMGNSNVSENETFKDGHENERADRTGAKLRGVGSTARSMPVQMARRLGPQGERALSPFLPTGFQNLLRSPAAWFTDFLTYKGFVSRDPVGSELSA